MGFNRHMRSVCGVAFLTVIGCLPVIAQVSGRIAGSVIDASGAAVPNADVEVYLAGGQKPLLTTKTAPDGQFNLIAVRPATYDISINAAGFVKKTIRNIAVDPGREISLPPIKVELASVSQTVDVSAGVVGVSTTNSEISHTITAEQVQNLPILDRDVLGLLQTQPGVVSSGNSATVINGLRTSYSN